MKNIKQITLAILLIITYAAYAQECEIPLKVIPLEHNLTPPTINKSLYNSLKTAVSLNGIAVEVNGNHQFFVTAQIEPIRKETLPGPPMLTSIISNLIIYIGDNKNQQVFASTNIEIRGAGKNETQAYINALKTLSSKNPQIQQLITKGKEKIIKYYDNNYINILKEANVLMNLKEYSAAIYCASTIPSCCAGYEEACQIMIDAYKYHIDNEGMVLLNKARAVWAANPNTYGATEAFDYLSKIDPASSSFIPSTEFVEEMHTSIKSDIDFEKRIKYYDELEFRRQRMQNDKDIRLAEIESARQIGVAYGRNQQPENNTIYWIR